MSVEYYTTFMRLINISNYLFLQDYISTLYYLFTIFDICEIDVTSKELVSFCHNCVLGLESFRRH